MENLPFAFPFQRPANNEVSPNDGANGGDNDSHALTKKEVDDILAKAKE